MHLPSELWLERLSVSHGTVAALTVDRGVRGVLGGWKSFTRKSIGHSVGGRDCCVTAAVDGLRALVMIGQASSFGGKLLKDCVTERAAQILAKTKQTLGNRWLLEQVLHTERTA